HEITKFRIVSQFWTLVENQTDDTLDVGTLGSRSAVSDGLVLIFTLAQAADCFGRLCQIGGHQRDKGCASATNRSQRYAAPDVRVARAGGEPHVRAGRARPVARSGSIDLLLA